MARVAHWLSRARGIRLGLLTAVGALVCAASVLGTAAGGGAPAATLRDPVNDVKAGDIDLTSISVAKRDGALVVRFTMRRPITDNVSYTASVAVSVGSWALVARRGHGVDSFLLYDLSAGTTTAVTGSIAGRTATVTAPISALGGQTPQTLGRVRAYFRAEPVGGRGGDADRAATGPTTWFCLADRQPRPKWGPCIWPGQIR